MPGLKGKGCPEERKPLAGDPSTHSRSPVWCAHRALGPRWPFGPGGGDGGHPKQGTPGALRKLKKSAGNSSAAALRNLIKTRCGGRRRATFSELAIGSWSRTLANRRAGRARGDPGSRPEGLAGLAGTLGGGAALGRSQQCRGAGRPGRCRHSCCCCCCRGPQRCTQTSSFPMGSPGETCSCRKAMTKAPHPCSWDSLCASWMPSSTACM